MKGGPRIMQISGSHRSTDSQQGLAYRVGEECDCAVGNPCGVTSSEEVGKDGVNGIGRKTHGLGEGARPPVCKKNKELDGR